MKLVPLFFVVLMVLIAYLTHLNVESVKFYYMAETYFSMSVVSLSLIAMSLGGLVVLLIGSIGGLRSFFVNWKDSREKKKEERINSLYVNAVNALTASRNKEAITFFKKILAIRPAHINALVRLGNIYKMEGDFSEALRLHRRAKHISDENLEISFAIIDDLASAFRYEEAIIALNDVTRANSSNITAYRHLRAIHIKKEEWTQALTAQESLLKLKISKEERDDEQKRYLELKYEVGLRHQEKGQADEARTHYEEVIKQAPEFIPAYMGVTDCYTFEGKRRDAARYLEKAYEQTGKPELLRKLEDLYIELGEPEKVIEAYQKGLKGESHASLMRLLLGKFYFRLEMLDDARDTLFSLSADDHPGISVMLGSIYARRGEYDMAAEEFKNLLTELDSHLFICESCNRFSSKWGARCPECGSWNSIRLAPVDQNRSLTTTPSTNPATTQLRV